MDPLNLSFLYIIIACFGLSTAISDTAKNYISLPEQQFPETEKCRQLKLDTDEDREALEATEMSEDILYFKNMLDLKCGQNVLPPDFPYDNLEEAKGIWFSYYRDDSISRNHVLVNITMKQRADYTVLLKCFLADVGKAKVYLYTGSAREHEYVSDGSRMWMSRSSRIQNSMQITIEFVFHSSGFFLLDIVELTQKSLCSTGIDSGITEEDLVSTFSSETSSTAASPISTTTDECTETVPTVSMTSKGGSSIEPVTAPEDDSGGTKIPEESSSSDYKLSSSTVFAGGASSLHVKMISLMILAVNVAFFSM